MDIAFAPALVRDGKAPETVSAAIGFRPGRSAPPKSDVNP
jgi:hypothetical protein